MATKTSRKVSILYEGSRAWNGIHKDNKAHFEVWYRGRLIWSQEYDPETDWYNTGLAEARKWCDENGYDYN